LLKLLSWWKANSYTAKERGEKKREGEKKESVHGGFGLAGEQFAVHESLFHSTDEAADGDAEAAAATTIMTRFPHASHFNQTHTTAQKGREEGAKNIRTLFSPPSFDEMKEVEIHKKIQRKNIFLLDILVLHLLLLLLVLLLTFVNQVLKLARRKISTKPLLRRRRHRRRCRLTTAVLTASFGEAFPALDRLAAAAEKEEDLAGEKLGTQPAEAAASTAAAATAATAAT
jgi:hypothetical protein